MKVQSEEATIATANLLPSPVLYGNFLSSKIKVSIKTKKRHRAFFFFSVNISTAFFYAVLQTA